MKRLCSLFLALLLVLSCMTAFAEPLTPYDGEAVVYQGYTADLGITEDRESPVYQAYKALIGNVTIEWSTGPWADFDTKTSMFLNTGDLPDIVWLRNSSNVVANYGDMGYFLNFMDYLDYMPNLKAYLEEYPQLSNLKAPDGALYCINDVEPTDYIDEGFFVNKTELDKLGLEVPKTWSEMLEAMRAYKAANPDGTPFITYGWGQSYYEYCLSSINGAHPAFGSAQFYYDGEKWTHPLLEEDSGYRELVEMMATMYSEGLLHPEYSTMSDDQAYQIVLDGTWLFSFWYLNTIWGEIFLRDEVPYEYEAMLAPAYEEGDSVYQVLTVPYDSTPGWGYFVNADVKNPELICSVLDTVISKEASELYNWGIKGTTFDVDENGNRYFLEGYTDSASRKAVGVENFMDVRYIQYKMRDVTYAGNGPVAQAAYDLIVGALANGDAIGIRALRAKPAFTAEQNEIVAANTTPMQTYIDENIMYFIDGTRPLDEWDAFVQETLQYCDMETVLKTYEEAEQIEYSTERKYVTYN